MKKNKHFFIKAVIILVLAVSALGYYFYYTINTPIDPLNKENISIVIKKGSSMNDVGSLLTEKGLIMNKTTFSLYSRYTGFDKKIIAGRFLLNKSMNVPDILKKLTTEAESEFVLTVQEGLTVNDIDAKLVALGVVEPGEFNTAVKNFNNYEDYWFLNKERMTALEAPLEGYLYPDTYYIDPVEFTPDQLIEKMLNNFEVKYKTLGVILADSKINPYDAIIMASILQREVRTPDDYNLVSGILWKRLDSGWHLGADATILYATKKKKIEPQDLEFDSPYNTRLHVGMPPGPICNPDIEHIKAAFTPQESDYWYYLTTLDTGEVIYAKTNDEQNINKAKYLGSY